MRDEACEVPKPLIVAVEELGDIAVATVKILRAFGAKDTRTFTSKTTLNTNYVKTIRYCNLVGRDLRDERPVNNLC